MKIKYINKRKLLKDIWIIIITIITPFLFFTYKLLPQNQDKLQIGSLIINAGDFELIDYVFWILSYKLLTLILLSVWFLSCSYKWKWIIIIPIMMEMYRLVSFINELFIYVTKSDFSFIHSIPFIFTYVSSLVLLKRHMNNKNDKLVFVDEINSDIIYQNKKLSKNHKKIKKEIKKLRFQKEHMSKKDYLKELIILRDKLTTD